MENPSSEGEQMDGRNPDGTFAPGHSHATGRRAGSRNAASLAIDTLLDGEAETITRKAIELATGGDMQAIKLVLDRVCPPRKTRAINIDLPDVSDAAGVDLAHAAVIQAVATGEISPDEGTALAGMLEARRKAIETRDHETRIRELEKSQNA